MKIWGGSVKTMNGNSLDITQDKLHRLKELFPEVFTEDMVDWEKLIEENKFINQVREMGFS